MLRRQLLEQLGRLPLLGLGAAQMQAPGGWRTLFYLFACNI